MHLCDVWLINRQHATFQVITGLKRPDLRGVKPSDLLGDLEVCDAFRKRSMLVTVSTTSTPAIETSTTEIPREDAQRGRGGSRTFSLPEDDDVIDNRIPSTGTQSNISIAKM